MVYVCGVKRCYIVCWCRLRSWEVDLPQSNSNTASMYANWIFFQSHTLVATTTTARGIPKWILRVRKRCIESSSNIVGSDPTTRRLTGEALCIAFEDIKTLTLLFHIRSIAPAEHFDNMINFNYSLVMD